MAKTITIELPYASFTAPIVNSTRSKLGQKGIKGGINIDLAEIPAAVLQQFLVDAITAHVQKDLKNVDPDTATTESCQEVMNTRYDLLKEGKTSLPGAARAKGGTKGTSIRMEAKRILKETIKDMMDEKPDGRQLNKDVNEFFKQYDAWVKAGSPDEALEAAPVLGAVAESIAEAKAQAEKREKMTKSLLGAMKAASEAPAQKPTEKVQAQKAAANAKKGKSA